MRSLMQSALIALLWTAAAAAAATRHVPAQYPNIQAAINDCNDGDTVIIAPGTYTGPGNRDIDFLGKPITVRSIDPNDADIVAATIIDCNGLGRAFYFHNGEDANSILAGLTITNGQQTTSPGGAIDCYGSGTHPLVVNCVITGNSASMGGGVYCYSSGITLDGCIISENSAFSTTGGGIHCNESNIVLINCTITNNTTLTGAFRYGGGIYLSGGSGLISHCVISDNSAWRGGAIASSSENLQVHHSFITDNFANQYGGALYLMRGASTFNCCTIAGNSIFSGNTIDAYGNHVFGNCIIRGGIEEGFTTVSYCNVEGGSPGEGNIDVDPLFVDANNGDYHLSPHSFCIDAGDPNYAPQPGETDIDGEPRLLGTRIDMGADEFSRTGPAIIVVSPTAVQFPPLFESQPDSAQTTILLLNRGIDNLNWRISETCPWLQADPIAGTAIDEPNEVILTVDPRGLSKGTYRCDLTISDSNASNNPMVLSVSLEIIGPILSVGASELNFQAYIETPITPDQTLSVQNTGGGTLYWEITVPDEVGWLIVYPCTGRSHGDINEVALHIDATGLPAGYYTSELTITDPNAANSPQVVEVCLHVGLEPGFLLVPGQFATIQSAIDWALPGDVVIIAPGTYTGPGNHDIDFLGKPITVRSIDPNDPNIVAETIIDCNRLGRAFYFHNGEDANSILAGLTITNGYAYNGAAICLGRHSRGEPDNGLVECRIFNCIITNNTAQYGGTVYCYDSNAVITNCTITGNSAYYGGAVYCYDSNAVIANCTITGNTAAYGGGGGVYCYHSDAVVTNCTIAGNSGYGGGAIYSEDSDAVIANCTISANQCLRGGRGSYGGGIYCSYGSLTITNCTISNNNIAIDYGSGGGIYFQRNSPIIGNCLFSANSAYSGGAIKCDHSDVHIANCTFAGNSADAGGAIAGLGNGATVTNSIFWMNRSSAISASTSTPVITYSNIPDAFGGVGNIDLDPFFVDPGYWDSNGATADLDDDFWVDGDYHLKSQGWRWDTQRQVWTWDDVTSRCIDAGDPKSPLGDELPTIPADPNGQWGRNIRINMGAFGGTEQASIPPLGWAIPTDYDNDGIANFTDFALWSENYAYMPAEPPAEPNTAPALNAADLALLADHWLDRTTWFGTMPLPTPAWNPTPLDGAIDVYMYYMLNWQPGVGAASHDVYFGPADPPQFQANQTATVFYPGSLSQKTTYYWRIDEVNLGGKTPGPLWSFTTSDTPPR